MINKNETMNRNELLNHFDKLYGGQETIRQELVFINSGLRSLEGKFDVLEKDVNELKTTTNRIEQKLDNHIKLPVELAHAR